jgi:hypothetical protein
LVRSTARRPRQGLAARNRVDGRLSYHRKKGGRTNCACSRSTDPWRHKCWPWSRPKAKPIGRKVARESYRKDAEAALKEFGDSTVFLTNFQDLSPSARAFSTKLSDATFDAGLIAYDDHIGLIFWAEDED